MIAATEPTVYLITGANRGIGLGLTSALLERPDTTVIAAVRDPNSPTSLALSDLPTNERTHLITIKIDSESETDARTAAQILQDTHNIHKLDVLIANAGIGTYYGPAVAAPLEEYTRHIRTNALAPMLLFQSFWPLLQNSHMPKFVATSSRLASIEQLDFWAGLPGDALKQWMPAAPYGSSKACLNYLLRRLHFEHEGLVAFPLSPGWVATEQGDKGAEMRGMKKAPISVEDSVRGMLDKVSSSFSFLFTNHRICWHCSEGDG